MTKEEQIIELKNKIDSIQHRYRVEYSNLAVRAEKLYDEQRLLDKEYKALDVKTGLNALYERLATLKED